MAAEGLPVTYEQFLESFGQKNAGILARWLGPGASPERIRAIGDAKEAEYRRLAREHGLTALPGATDWLERLHAEGWKQAIASSAPRENVGVMLEGSASRAISTRSSGPRTSRTASPIPRCSWPRPPASPCQPHAASSSRTRRSGSKRRGGQASGRLASAAATARRRHRGRVAARPARGRVRTSGRGSAAGWLTTQLGAGCTQWRRRASPTTSRVAT